MMFSFCVGVCVVGGGEEGTAINNVNVQWNKMQAVLITADGDKNKKAKSFLGNILRKNVLAQTTYCLKFNSSY